MTFAQQMEFENLPTPEARAAWLLDKGVTAALDIDAAELDLVWRACACGVTLPGKYTYTGTRTDAIRQGIAWLRFKAASKPSRHIREQEARDNREAHAFIRLAQKK